jgi:hypothetical protein
VSLSAQPIDAVITWVDGSDPAHAARLAAYLQEIGGQRPASAHPTRFNDAGELEYCVTSILRFAPWLRTIHIVTDRQVPPLLGKLRGTSYEGKVRVVDHRDIFVGHEQHLPTFNSRAIITALWRIPELAEQFLFFNDDFVLLQPVAPTDFFRDDTMIVRGRWQRQSEYRPLRRLLRALRRWSDRDPARTATQRVKNLAAQEESARLAGYEREYLRMYHTPFTQRRSTLQRWFAAHPEKLEHNLGFRLRSPLQFKTEVLAAHLEFAQGSAQLDTHLRMVQLKPSEQWFPRLKRKLAQADRDARVAFACVQSLELAPRKVQRHLIDWLDRRVGRLDALLQGAAAPAAQ